MAEFAAERLGIQSLGWFVRRGLKPPGEIAPFYQSAWGLRAPRSPGPTGSMMFWGGDLAMFEVAPLTPGPSSASRAGEMSVVMGTSDFRISWQRMLDAGASEVSQRESSPQMATLTDPEGRLLGLLENAGQAAGPKIELKGLPALPGDLDRISRVIVRVQDPVAMASFYQRVLRLEAVAPVSDQGVLLALGRGVSLELQPGGHRYDAPADRGEVPDVWILRVADHDALTERFHQMDVRIVSQVKITGGVLTYAVDPEGHLFGIQQRTRDLLPPDREPRVEDTAAWAVWSKHSG